MLVSSRVFLSFWDAQAQDVYHFFGYLLNAKHDWRLFWCQLIIYSSTFFRFFAFYFFFNLPFSSASASISFRWNLTNGKQKWNKCQGINFWKVEEFLHRYGCMFHYSAKKVWVNKCRIKKNNWWHEFFIFAVDGRCRTIRFYHRHSFRNFIKIKLFCLAPKKPNGHTHTQGTVFFDQHQKVADYSVSVHKEIVKALLAFSSKSINALIN